MLKGFKKLKHGQSALEYAFLIIIVLAVFLAMGNYFKRGLQGRWQSSVDELGDQYDPRFANSNVTHTLSSNTSTQITAINILGGSAILTLRTDLVNSVEQKNGSIAVGAY